MHWSMRIRSSLDVTADLLTTTTEVAELAKAAVKFGANITMRPDQERDGTAARLWREEGDGLSEDLPRLVLLLAIAEDKTVDQVLQDVRARLVAWHAPMDRPPSDMAGIGEDPASYGQPRAD